MLAFGVRAFKGAGAKLRLSRGFPRQPACDVTPVTQSFVSLTILRENATLLVVRVSFALLWAPRATSHGSMQLLWSEAILVVT